MPRDRLRVPELFRQRDSPGQGFRPDSKAKGEIMPRHSGNIDQEVKWLVVSYVLYGGHLKTGFGKFVML